MNEQGYETLKRFSEKVKKISPSERKKIEKMVGEHKTFIGAAWVYFSQSTPAKAPTTKAPTTKAPTTKAPTTKAPTKAPTTKAPTTKAPTTKAPTTKAPTPKAPTPKAPTPVKKLTPYVKELGPGIRTIHFKNL